MYLRGKNQLCWQIWASQEFQLGPFSPNGIKFSQMLSQFLSQLFCSDWLVQERAPQPIHINGEEWSQERTWISCIYPKWYPACDGLPTEISFWIFWHLSWEWKNKSMCMVPQSSQTKYWEMNWDGERQTSCIYPEIYDKGANANSATTALTAASHWNHVWPERVRH